MIFLPAVTDAQESVNGLKRLKGKIIARARTDLFFDRAVEERGTPPQPPPQGL